MIQKKSLSPHSGVSSLMSCGQQDLNLHGLPPEPKSGASANSAMPAYLKIYCYKEKMTKTFSDSVM